MASRTKGLRSHINSGSVYHALEIASSGHVEPLGSHGTRIVGEKVH